MAKSDNTEVLLSKIEARERIEEEGSVTVEIMESVEIVISPHDDLVRIDYIDNEGSETMAVDPSAARTRAHHMELIGAIKSATLEQLRPYNDVERAIGACADIVDERRDSR